MKKIILSSTVLAAFAPIIASAQVTDITSLFTLIKSVLTAVLPLIIGLAVVYFVWGVLKYVMSAGDEEAQKEGRSMMLYGIIAIFVMVSVWGLVNILVSTFGLTTTAVAPPVLP